MRGLPFYLFNATSIVLSASCFAQTSLGLAGVQASSTSTYAYAGEIRPLNGNSLGQGGYRKIILSWLAYDYQTMVNSVDTNIQVKSPGIEAGFGYAWKTGSLNLDVSAMAGYRHRSFSPVVPSDERAGTVLTLSPQLQARLDLRAGFDADLLANHAIGLGSTFARARVGWKPEASWRVGVEAIQSQGPTYRVRQQGAFVMWPLTRDVSIDLSAGRAKSQDGVQSGYLGLGLSRLF